MADYKLGVVLEAKDKMTAAFQSGLAGLKRLRTGCTSAAGKIVEVQKEAQKAGKGVDDLGKKAQGASKGVGSLAGNLTGLVGGFVGIGAAAAGINMFKQFDDTMLSVKAKTGATGEAFTALREKAKELGATTRFSATEAARGMDFLAMAGYKTNDIIDAMPGLLNLAAASGEDLANVSDIVSDAMTAFQWAAKDTEKFADVMAYAASNSNTSVGMMGESFKYVASVAHSAGVSAQETATALAMMANAGVKGSMSGTALRSSLIRLMKPPKEAADAMAHLGVQAIDSTGNFVGLRNIVAQMTEKTQGMTKAQKASAAAAIFGTEAVSGMMGMINQGPEAFDKFLAGVEGSKGAADKMAATMNSGIGGAIDNMTSALENVVICAGEKFAPTISKAASYVADFSMTISQVDFGAVAAGVAGLTSAFTAFSVASSVKNAGGLLLWLAPAKVAVASISMPILAGAAAVGVLVAAGLWLADNWDTLDQKAGVWGVIGGDIKTVIGAIANEIEYVVGVVSNELAYLSGIFGNELAYIGGIVSNEFLYVRGVVVNEFKYVSGVIKNELAYASGVVGNELQYIKDKFSDVSDFISGAIDGINQFLSDHGDTLQVTAGIVTGIFAPALIKSGIEATIAGGKIAADFISGLITSGKEAVINGMKITLNFVASTIDAGKNAVSSGVQITKSLVGAIRASGVEAVATAKKITGSLVASTAAYVAQGWKAAYAIGAQCVAWTIQKGIMIGTALAQNIVTLATGAWILAGTIASGITWALGAAFAFLTSPIGLVVLAIAGVVAAGIWMYNNWDEIIAWLNVLWNDPLKAIDEFIVGAKNMFTGIFDWLGEKWSWITSLFSKPIKANVQKGDVDVGGIDHNATGTGFFSGGLTEVNERGGEIIDLPHGSRIYPAATTQRMLKQEFQNTNTTSKPSISISGNTFVIREEADFDKIADALVRKLERASMNAGMIQR